MSGLIFPHEYCFPVIAELIWVRFLPSSCAHSTIADPSAAIAFDSNPVAMATDDSPVLLDAEWSPVLLDAEQSPVLLDAERSPVLLDAE